MTENEENKEYQIPDKSLIFAKATSLALSIVLISVGLIFVILYFVK